MFKGGRYVVESKGICDKSPCTNLKEILNFMKLFCFCAYKMFILSCYVHDLVSPPDNLDVSVLNPSRDGGIFKLKKKTTLQTAKWQ